MNDLILVALLIISAKKFTQINTYRTDGDAQSYTKNWY